MAQKVLVYQGRQFLDMGGTACPYEIINGRIYEGESRAGWMALAYGEPMSGPLPAAMFEVDWNNYGTAVPAPIKAAGTISPNEVIFVEDDK